MCLRTDILTKISDRQWRECLSNMLWGASIASCHLLLDNNFRLSISQVCVAIRSSSFPFFLRKTVAELEKISRAMLESIETRLILEEQDLLSIVVSECGREDLILDLYSKGVTFDHFEGAPLFNATLFGYHRAVKVLLNVCHVNSSIFHSGRTVVIALLCFDHLALGYAMITAGLSVINEIFCRALYNEGPNIVMFSWSKTTQWCIADTSLNTPWSSIFVFLFFFIAYSFLNLFCKFFPLLYCLFMVKTRIVRAKRTAPLAVIEQDSATTIVVE
jgi:hypothetical protein